MFDTLFIMSALSDWVVSNMNAKAWDQAEVARRAGLTQATISRIISGSRNPGDAVIEGIARAFNRPVQEVMRAAGKLPPVSEADEMQERLDHLFNTLKNPANKRRAIRQLELLQDEEESVTDLNSKTQPH